MAQNPTPTPIKRKKPLGKAIRHTGEQLDQMAQSTPDIEAEAAARWKASAGKLANLLDSKPKDQTPNA